MLSYETNNVTQRVNPIVFVGTLALHFIIFVLCLYRKVEVPQLNFDTREDLDWVAWFQSMSGKNNTSTPGFVARAIAEAKKQKQAAEAEKLPSEDTIPKETTAKTTDNAKAKKVKEEQGAEAADKASTKRVREVANKDKTNCDMEMKSRYLRGLLKKLILVALPGKQNR